MLAFDKVSNTSVRSTSCRFKEPLWDFISALLTDEALLFSKIKVRQEETRHSTRLLEQNLIALQTENQNDRTAIKRYLDLYGDGVISKNEYLRKRKERESKIEARSKKITEHKQQLQETAPLTVDREQALRKLRDKVSRRIQAATFEQKQELYSLLQVECTYNDVQGQVVVTGVFGSHSLELKAKNESNQTPIEQQNIQLTGRFRYPGSFS